MFSAKLSFVIQEVWFMYDWA